MQVPRPRRRHPRHVAHRYCALPSRTNDAAHEPSVRNTGLPTHRRIPHRPPPLNDRPTCRTTRASFAGISHDRRALRRSRAPFAMVGTACAPRSPSPPWWSRQPSRSLPSTHTSDSRRAKELPKPPRPVPLGRGMNVWKQHANNSSNHLTTKVCDVKLEWPGGHR